MRALRVTVGAAGVATMSLGAVLLAAPDVREPFAVLEWLVAAVVLHDGILVPVVLGVGALLPPRPRRAVRGALIVAACLTAVALPALLRPGRTANPSVLPLDYGRNLLIVLAAVAAVTTASHAVRRLTRRRPR